MWQGSNATNQNYGAALVKKNSNSQDAIPPDRNVKCWNN